MDNKNLNSPTVVHLINGLNLGGSESMLVNLIKFQKNIKPSKTTVITLGKGNYFKPQLQDLGVEVIELPITTSPLKSIKQLLSLSKGKQIICSWSYHTHLFSVLLKFRFKTRLVWLVRHADVGVKNNKLATWAIMRICATLSPICDAITFNGQASKTSHRSIGFRARKMEILPNGCDTNLYSPDTAPSKALLEIVGTMDPKPSVILSAARWHSIKDHPTFINAFALIKDSHPAPVIAILCGAGISKENLELISLIDQSNLEVDQDVFLLGQRDDLPNIMASSNIYVMHSKSEAFPNTLIQAMAAGLRVVSTDVGTVEQLANGAFPLIRPADAQSLSLEILHQINQNDPQVDSHGRTLRQIILDEYSIMSIIPEYEDIILGEE